MPKGYVYILECADGSYYTGSTIDVEKRIAEHNEGKGANHTKKRLPVALKYIEEFQRIDDAFYREKQIQGWSRAKKEALINNNSDKLPELSLAYRDKKNQDGGFENLSHQKYEDNNKLNKPVPEALEGTLYYKSNGKLLITGEYVVLDGAKSLAIPTKYGQSLKIEEDNNNTLIWKSYDEKGNVWFENSFTLENGKILKTIGNDNDISSRLVQILESVQQLNPNFLKTLKGYKISTHLEFNRKWGLGTSSTLINNIAQWADVNAYQLLEKTFGGSGYDIACAQHNTPITFQLKPTNSPIVNAVEFNPSFKNNLYFVYLNQKQNSRDGIKAYRALNKLNSNIISEVIWLTESIINCTELSIFENLITKHEELIGQLINQTPIKSRFFSDYNGCMKSLGAWGGDFILVTSESDPSNYFKSKGLDVIIPFTEMAK
ncbi:GYDIA family GHMP kinase [Winogradskyella algicola]|uniref:GYDIA family GHMP kinase n=1 Tax=Winogradskyella algicola TaxID=2575815 RepID=UPI001109100A|nr:GYDIA family GHMP kinase [Winogradskyella algicola]